MPSRTIGWSSTRSSLIFLGLSFFTGFCFGVIHAFERHLNYNLGSRSRSGVELVVTPDKGGALAHIHQPHAGRFAFLARRAVRVEAATIVADGRAEVGGFAAQLERHMIGAGMFFDIAEGFLDNAVKIEFDIIGDGLRQLVDGKL